MRRLRCAAQKEKQNERRQHPRNAHRSARRRKRSTAVILSGATRVEVRRIPVPGVVEYHDPVWLVQRAWSTFRLPALQALIRSTIAELGALSPEELLGREPAEPTAAGWTQDPVSEALKACSEELRDACGIAEAEAERAQHCSQVRGYTAQQPLAWSEAFTEALDKYRRAASARLLVRLDANSTVA